VSAPKHLDFFDFVFVNFGDWIGQNKVKTVNVTHKLTFDQKGTER